MLLIKRVVHGFLLSASISLNVVAQTSDSGNTEKTIEVPTTCDSVGFLEFAKRAEELRAKRLLSEAEFAKLAKEEKTIVLDARSDGSFDSLRIKGSKNLPYTSFSEKNLQELVPDRSTRILIYCRNNLVSTPQNKEILSKKDRHPYPDELGRGNVIKSPKVALNIPTYITLMVYGYENVWQLDALVDPNNSVLEFESKWPEEQEAEMAEIEELFLKAAELSGGREP